MAERAKTTSRPRASTRKSTGTKAAATKRTTKRKAPSKAKAESGLPPVSKHGGVDPEWHNDPARTQGLDVQERLGEGKGKVEMSTFNPQAHHELTINFTELTPNTEFVVKITGPIAAAYYATLKTDDWGQAQLIWRTPTGGDYLISGEGQGISVSTEFSITSYDADRDYRAERRAAAGKGRSRGRSKPKAEAATGSVATVEEPAVMGDTSSTEAKNQPTEDELANPAMYDPASQPAKSPSESSEETGSEEAGKDKE